MGSWEKSQRSSALTEGKLLGSRPQADGQQSRGREGSGIQLSCVALTLHHPLRPPPCACRKYLRDADRQVLAQRAFILTVKVLEDTLSELAEVCRPQPLSFPRWRPSSCHSHTGALGRSPCLHLWSNNPPASPMGQMHWRLVRSCLARQTRTCGQ